MFIDDRGELYSALLNTNKHDVQYIVSLLTNGHDPNQFISWGWGGMTIFQAACKYLSLDIVKLLLEHGADPHKKCYEQRSTAITHATQNTIFPEVLEYFVDILGIEPSDKDVENSAFCVESLRLYMKRFPSKVQSAIQTIIERLAHHGDLEVITEVETNGFRVGWMSFKDPFSLYIDHVSISKPVNAELIEYLIAKGVPVNCKKTKRTCISFDEQADVGASLLQQLKQLRPSRSRDRAIELVKSKLRI